MHVIRFRGDVLGLNSLGRLGVMRQMGPKYNSFELGVGVKITYIH